MKLIIAIIFAVIGSILIGSSVNELSSVGNGLIKVLGAIFLISAIYIGRKQRYKK